MSSHLKPFTSKQLSPNETNFFIKNFTRNIEIKCIDFYCKKKNSSGNSMRLALNIRIYSFQCPSNWDKAHDKLIYWCGIISLELIYWIPNLHYLPNTCIVCCHLTELQWELLHTYISFSMMLHQNNTNKRKRNCQTLPSPSISSTTIPVYDNI